MTQASTSPARRSLRYHCRQAVVALMVGAGIALTPLPAVADSGSAATVAVNTALAQLGDRYVWAGAGPDVFDCSGLTQYAYRAAGINLPHNSLMQSRIGTPVARAALRPGDLVFFYRPIHHVAMYIGNGKVVQAPHSGDVVKISNLAAMAGYVTARRVT